MSISSTERTRLEARLATKEAQLDVANTTLSSLLSKELDSYRFDSGESAQSAQRKSVTQLERLIRLLESEIDSIRRRLNGAGLVNFALRRN
jgi:uncharacterized small protein (DUF1192 family)